MTQALEITRGGEARSKDEARWGAIVARNRSYDGKFYYSVASTGVYCRPSCPARRAKRPNVRFHDTIAEAEAAGFQPCKRCRPNEASLEAQHAAIIASACRRIEEAEEGPKLDELAQSVGLSSYHFHRLFKAITGVTPKAYAVAHRQKRVREKLGTSKSVTEAIYDSGGGARRARRHLVYVPHCLTFGTPGQCGACGHNHPAKALWRGAKGGPGLPVAHRPGACPQESAAGMAKNGYVVKIAG
jgi:methylphosphotriester-DNA--protein-cysteine methyltransferase